MSGIVITLSLLACVLAISEACNQASQGGLTGGNTLPPSADGDNSYGPGSGPVPPHPFRRRRDDDSDNSALTLQSQAMSKMMRRLFDELDADDDQSVTAEEWVRRRGNAEDYRQVLAEFDKNDDDVLSFDEFLAASKS
ncbi:uncharacterized protein LOC119722430 [Patiria miniata]|uniref:EF-hand domain-containing protein n=1 Tax=Patiria miniata TaxID=46514 RepID=A0A913ZBQ7_PATMI|nr:uncharacterized protein LOC119722430 [Patiria miniata]